MSYVLIILLIIIILFLLYGIMVYNKLVQASNNIDKSWANIDVLLKQRAEQLPKLISVVKSYMEYEESVLKQLTDARTKFLSATTIDDKVKTENQMEKCLKNLFAISENYPDLKSNQAFLDLQKQINTLEQKIADRREFYNETVNIFNIFIKQFPDIIIANALMYQKHALLQVPEEQRQDVKIEI